MFRFSRVAAAAVSVIVLSSCSANEGASSDSAAVAATPAGDPAADEQAIRAVNDAWFKAFQAGDIDGVAGQYASDAVVSPPGAASLRGSAAIREYFAKEVPGLAAAGLAQAAGANPEIMVSGDLGYEWNTYSVTDKAGKTVDSGKYLSVFGRRDGKWVIIRDIWNSDAAPAS
jgi:uncharacterized protein (TIGR02246 family)